MPTTTLFRKTAIALLLFGLSVLSYGQAPGGVTADNILWLKANEGLDLTTDVTNWADQSGTGNHATQTNAIYRPSIYTHSHNYNPSVYFDGTAEHLNLDDLLDPLSTGFSLIAVGTNEAGGDQWHAMVSGQSDNQWTSGGYGLGSFEGNVDFGFWVNTWMNHSSNTWIGATGMPAAILEGKFDNSEILYYRDANQSASAVYTGTIGDGGDTYLGAGGGVDSDNHFGHIAEVIMYSSAISDMDRNKISSYLGIKYGVTISRYGVDDNYITSSETSIYSGEGIGEYWHGIVGIGRDDSSELLQKQSHDHYDNCRIYLDDLQIENVSNAGSFPTDEQFVVVGNDGDYTSVVIQNNTEKPVGIYSRLAREWKVTNTIHYDTYSIAIRLNFCVDIADINVANLRLLVDSDGDFTDATIYDSTTGPNLVLDGHMIIIEDIPNTIFPPNTSTYFTIASIDDITLSDVFEALPIADIHTCDINENGIAEFTIDHVDIETQVIGGQPDLSVSYVDENGDDINFPDLFTNTIPYTQTIIVRVTNSIDCYDETTLQLIVDPLPLVDTIANAVSCSFYEFPDFTNPDNAYYTGLDATGDQMYPGDLIDTLGSTTLYIYADDGACVNQSSFTITVEPIPTIDTSMVDVEVCGSYVLELLTAGEGEYYTDTGGPTGTGTLLDVGDAISTTSTVYVYVSNGTCEDEYSFEVIINPIHEFDLSLNNIVIDNQVDIEVNLESLPIGYEYQIDGGLFQSENTFLDLAAGNHTLTVRTENECTEHSIDFWITIFYIPEFFSPNNDGYNDFWKIEDTDNTITSIRIYDRFGNNIANPPPSSQGWDGSINQNPAPSTDYWYVVEILTDNKVIKGNFTLKR